ncbi:MAG: class I SAM-dependent methyltransferase [Actinobacteria bacterium]|nr:class I SAM-dependent methyltransferase [Actinomycetota bacterium]
MNARAGIPAPDWGVGHYERTAEKLLPAARVLVDVAAPHNGEHVVDAGCGTGNVALLAAVTGARVTAVDPSPRLLGVTEATARTRGLEITCKLGEAAALPLPDDSVDCYLSNFGLIFAPDADAAAAETARVLAAGGRALFTAWLPGGALGALAAAAEEMVRAALGAPKRAPVPWHDASAVSALFARHDLTSAIVGRHDLVFTGPSPEAYLDAELASHPLAIAGLKVLEQRGLAEEARDRLLGIVTEANEETEGFGSTSQYVVVMARSI